MSTFSQRPYTDCRLFPFEYFFLLDASLKFNNFLILKLMTFYKHSFHTERITKIQSRLLVFEIWLIFQWFWISDKSAEKFKQVCYNTSVLSFWIPLFYSLSYFYFFLDYLKLNIRMLTSSLFFLFLSLTQKYFFLIYTIKDVYNVKLFLKTYVKGDISVSELQYV